MFLASNCTCAVYFTYTAHVRLLAKNMAATHVHAICIRICIRNQTNTLRFCREDNPLYVFTLYGLVFTGDTSINKIAKHECYCKDFKNIIEKFSLEFAFVLLCLCLEFKRGYFIAQPDARDSITYTQYSDMKNCNLYTGFAHFVPIY